VLFLKFSDVLINIRPIFQSLSKGGNNRIKEGAKLVQNAQDIVEDYCIFTEQK